MSAALLNERNEFDLRKITRKEIGIAKLGLAQKALLAQTAQVIVGKAKGINAQMQVTAIMRKNLNREVHRAIQRKDEKINKLEDDLRKLVQRS